MRALRIDGINQLVVREVPVPKPGAGDVLVAIHSAALNHRDVWIKKGQYAGLKYPCIPGSDGAGIVDWIGEGVDLRWMGKEVVINPGFGWGPSEVAQSPTTFSILGLPRDGTLAEFVAVPAEQLAPKPAHLPWNEAAALPLAGLTAYRALVVRAQVKAGEKVLITGIGGGVALFCLQFAVALGASVWVTSSSQDKIARAVALGAKGGFLYTEPSWAATATAQTGGFDVIIDSAGGDGFSALLDTASPGGRIAFFGATRGNPGELALRKVFWRQLSILGSTMGSPRDWAAMVNLVEAHHIKPVVSDVIAARNATEAFDLMERGGQFGKIVVQFAGDPGK